MSNKNKIKYKRNNYQKASKTLKLKRNHILRFSYDKGQIIVSNENGVPYDLGTQTVVRSYQGASKEHIVAKATDLEFSTDCVSSWTENFDMIFAIDTNTNPIKYGEFFCSVGVAYLGEVEKVNDYLRNMVCKPYMVIDWYHPSGMKIEPVTWMEVIKHLQLVIPSNMKIGIVIDSELGNLEEYNSRNKPVFGQWILPENYAFIYATANCNDEWCNKIIKQCDKTASKRLKEVIANPSLNRESAKGYASIGFISFLDESILINVSQ